MLTTNIQQPDSCTICGNYLRPATNMAVSAASLPATGKRPVF